jgi:hypothetical protein
VIEGMPDLQNSSSTNQSEGSIPTNEGDAFLRNLFATIAGPAHQVFYLSHEGLLLGMQARGHRDPLVEGIALLS